MSSDGLQTPGKAFCLRVTVTAGPHAGQTKWWTEPGRYLIGRSAQAHLPLSHDLLVSPEHCRLELNERGCVVEDLASRQGTLVNGSRVGRSLLASRDKLKIGMTELEIVLEESSAFAATVLRRQSVPGDSTPDSERGQRPFRVPGYEIVRKVGAGGMGVVYEAKQKATGSRVALKTIIPAAGASPQAIPLFLREAEVLSQLVHPRIVRFLDCGERQGVIYLAMEYVDAVDLAACLSSVPADRRTAICCGVMCQVLDALQHAHSRGLVHRDVKPRNILVAQEGNRLPAKLADFGLAKNYHQAGLSRLTKEGELRGTPAFMPEEQFRDSRSARPSADIYAAGATLYWYLTGSTPLAGAQRGRSRAAATDVVPLRDLRPDLPSAVIDAIDRSLAADPADRFATAADFRRALKPYAAG